KQRRPCGGRVRSLEGEKGECGEEKTAISGRPRPGRRSRSWGPSYPTTRGTGSFIGYACSEWARGPSRCVAVASSRTARRVPTNLPGRSRSPARRTTARARHSLRPKGLVAGRRPTPCALPEIARQAQGRSVCGEIGYANCLRFLRRKKRRKAQ